MTTKRKQYIPESDKERRRLKWWKISMRISRGERVRFTPTDLIEAYIDRKYGIIDWQNRRF